MRTILNWWRLAVGYFFSIGSKINKNQTINNAMARIALKNSNYLEAQKCWTELSPYIWGKSTLNKNYKYE